MARTQVVIVYSPNQGIRRTTIIPDDDSQIPVHTKNIAPGEAVMVGTLSDYRRMGPDAMLARFLGRKPTTDTCAVINAAGIVVHVIRADPAIDRHTAGRLHRDTNGKAVVGSQAKDLGLLP
jgi:hypothetical protein